MIHLLSFKRAIQLIWHPPTIYFGHGTYIKVYYTIQGWNAVDSTRNLKQSSEKLVEAREYGKTLINQKQSEHLKSFIFWPSPNKRCGESIYEISTTELTPGKFITLYLYTFKSS